MDHLSDRQGERAISDYVAILRRRKWIVLTAVILVPIAAATVAASQPKLYSASSDVLLTSSATSVESPLNGDANSPMETQIQLATSPAIAERVIKASKTTLRSAGDLLSEVSVGQVGASAVLRISVTDPSAALATQLATDYATQYTEYRRELDSAFVGKARKELEARMAALRAVGATHSAVYVSLASKDQQLLTIQALETASAVVIRTPGGAAQVQPSPVKWGVFGLILGLILGASLALLREALDTRVRGADEISKLLRQPLLGRIPAPPKLPNDGSRLVMLAESNGPAAESFRVLRTNLDFVRLDQATKMVLVTSPLPGEGKSTTAANLAIAIARGGSRCVLVELDLRRPVFKDLFGLRGQAGLTTVALGAHDLDEAIERVPVSGHVASTNGNGNGRNGHSEIGVLEVLQAGPLPPDPGEFVMTTTVRSILAGLRERADFIILDTPPLIGVGDTVSLSAVVDGVVLVTRIGETKRPLLRETHRILGQMRAAKLGFVLTGAEREEHYGYAGYSYYYRQNGSSTSKALESAGH